MHGRVQREGESCRSLRRSSSQHMRSVLPLATNKNTVAVAGDHNFSLASPITTTTSSDSFFKDGRKIAVGDCALFKPPQDSPPFIGLIRGLRLSEENNLHLGVNWLYRPAELHLGKGTLVEAAPNEVFYSFHKDETPAASLLHPCRVAFLPRGVELPAGTSSFVCRRIYDIANKCLWWLTDQDYINGRQEEVDKLLCKTRTEMHAKLQPGGRSPKQVNGPASTTQLKPSNDCSQNDSSLYSQVKGKKRERGDHSGDPVKRERFVRTDDGDSLQCKIENNLKSEIARITEKGGVVDLEGVEKLVQLMQQDRAERKMDLANRSMLAGVMAATDKVDCLNRFVQLRGLAVLDEWLQDIHKGKIGDGNNLKDSDKSEEFLLVLLRALDKLPVNLQALQMCNIGRSVNHLRTHKNVEIQRKARSLVDTWKKRVEAEMISIDAKSGSAQGVSVWPSKSRVQEASHGGRTPNGSDVGVKSSVTPNSASKTTSAMSSHGESNIKSAAPVLVKPLSSPSSGKDGQHRISAAGTPDVPVVREDRSSSSNQSHNYSQSSSGKEEGKSITASSVNANKMSSSSTRNRKISGFTGVTATGSQKEINSSRNSSAHKSTGLEKLSQSALSTERALEGPISEGSSHKLIVKLPNRVRSPAQGVGGGSLEDSTYMSSRVSSPVLSDKHEQLERNAENKNDTYRSNAASDMNIESSKNNNSKDVPTGSAEGAGSPAANLHEDRSMATEDSGRLTEDPPTNQLKPGKLHASSFSPMNALVESCAKYSEANTSLSSEDDVGMNLLASVAAGEMSRSDVVSPNDSPERSAPAAEEVCNGDEAKSKCSPENNIDGVQNNDGESDDKKLGISSNSEDVPAVEGNKHFESSSMDVRSNADHKLEVAENLSEKTGTTDLTVPMSEEKAREGELNEGKAHEEKATSSVVSTDGLSNCKSGGIDDMVTEEKTTTDLLSVDEGKPTVEAVTSTQFCEGDSRKDANEGFNTGTDTQKILTSTVIKHEFPERATNEKLQRTSSCRKSVSEAGEEVKVGEPDEKDAKGLLIKSERTNCDMEVDRDAADSHGIAGLCSTSIDLKNHHKEANVENKGIIEHISAPEIGSKSASIQQDEAEESVSNAAEASSSAAGAASDADTKIKFDLNEGFSDEGKYAEPINLMSSSSTTLHMVNSLAFPVNSITSSHSASITVAAAAKGPFVPPEDLLRSKGELGWKGSAATSAFRPAEPRKVPETPSSSTNVSCNDASSSKHGRMPLDIDLNVPDERVLEEMACRDSVLTVDSATDFVSNRATLLNVASDSVPVRDSGVLDLDLNRVDEANDNGNCSTSSNRKGDGFVLHVKPLGGLTSGDNRRDFDLNDGPGDDTTAEQLPINQHAKGSIPTQLPSSGLRMNNPGMGSFSSWFSPGNTYSTVAIPSMLPDRGEHPFPVFPPSAPQRTFGPSGVTPFTPDIYRGSVLSSSPAMPFPSGPFQFPVFPFGGNFPPASFPVGATSYADSLSGPRLFAPPVHSQLLGPVGSVTPQFQRPYLVGLPESSSNGGLENNRKWSRQGLDLNAGPGAMDNEAREEMLPLTSGQHSVVSSQALAEEQARMYSISGGLLKRKEPEGGWENENFRYKQSSWQ